MAGSEPEIEGATGNRAGDETSLSQRIRVAVIECLDELGYAGTSIQRIQERAGVSRGALTYHFASKEDLMVETAEHLLQPTLSPRRAAPADKPVTRDDIVDTIHWMWNRVVDTREGRALLEILVASRCDPALRGRISSRFSRWHHEINARLIERYDIPHLDPSALGEIWTICRIFMRGLNTQRQFDEDDSQIKALTHRFAHTIAVMLVPDDPREDPASGHSDASTRD